MKPDFEKVLDEFLEKDQEKPTTSDDSEGELIFSQKNDIVERINKKYLTEDGRQLLHD